MNKKQVIIDTDPGIDDAVALAIALFSSEIDVKLITTVAGNVGLNHVTQNALKLLKFLNKDIPVAKGVGAPLIREIMDASSIHGETGMEGFIFEEPDDHLLLKEHAVNAMREVIMTSKESVTIIGIGPLTNIAMLLTMYPETKTAIKEIIFMGGSLTRGNSGVMSEYNIDFDPEAAKIVFNSGVRIVMVGLDLGLKALILPEDSTEIKEMNKVGDMFYHLFKRYRGGNMQSGLTMYDSTAIAYLLRPDIFDVVDTFMDVELTGKYTKGATIVDLEGFLNKESNATVCVDINQIEFKKWFLTSNKKCI
ncbi:MAG: ribonucleoside hydrolase RihC [Carnobacterium sp.]|uniref:ribonucleoside hydrolase RihC n=1 Tax=Carnobacterium sp. TaxID=48221 RepID=UPI003C742F8E